MQKEERTQMRPCFAGGDSIASVASLTLDYFLLTRDANGKAFL